jgi:hypothetical protein
MRNITLNGIVRSILNQQRKPIHYYGRYLKYASDCIRELIFDTLKITNTVRIPLNDFFEAEIPSDAVDICQVGTQQGQFVRPLVRKNTINHLANFNTDDGSQIVYPDSDASSDVLTGAVWIGAHRTARGEDTGGYYGIGAGSEPDTYDVFEDRNVIQCNQKIGVTKIVVEYVGDGTYTNAATKITPYAQKTIETYIDWQYKEHSKSFGAYDAQRAKAIFDREHEKLRARKDNLTPELLTRIINRHRKASLK